jgi:hypothetical protein
MVGEFLLKSGIGRPKSKYVVRNRDLRRLFFRWRLCEFHALYPPSAGPEFTCEEEKNGQLLFLDLILEREDGEVVFDIYRKPTDAPLCIPNHSHHPITHKLAAFESALYRMWAVPLDRDKREKELKYIVQMAIINGYKEETILRLNEKHKRRKELRDFTTLKPQKKDKKRRTQDRMGVEVAKNLVIPYYAPLTEKLENLNVCYQNRGSLRDCIGVVKD